MIDFKPDEESIPSIVAGILAEYGDEIENADCREEIEQRIKEAVGLDCHCVVANDGEVLVHLAHPNGSVAIH